MLARNTCVQDLISTHRNLQGVWPRRNRCGHVCIVDAHHVWEMDTLGFEPRAFRMRSGCDTTTPCAQLICHGASPLGWQTPYRPGGNTNHYTTADSAQGGIGAHIPQIRPGSANDRSMLHTCSADVPKAMWTHWGLNPGPSACEADVIPLHHVPLNAVQTDVTFPTSQKASGAEHSAGGRSQCFTNGKRM